MALVIERKTDEEVLIEVGDTQINLCILQIRDNKRVRIGFVAPNHVHIYRTELKERIERDGRDLRQRYRDA